MATTLADGMAHLPAVAGVVADHLHGVATPTLATVGLAAVVAVHPLVEVVVSAAVVVVDTLAVAVAMAVAASAGLQQLITT